MPDCKFPLTRSVVLAAGRSLRMGRIKALLPWPPQGTPCVIHVIEQLRDGGAAPVAVVTGPHHDAIAAAVGTDAVVLFNPRHDEGQLSSLQCGLDWAFGDPAVAWATVTLVDLPGVSAATVRLLLTAATGSEALVVRPLVDGQHGHPVLWSRNAWPLVRAAGPEEGARHVVRRLAAEGRVLDVPVDDGAVLRDIDTPQEYLDLLLRKSEVGSQKGEGLKG